MHERLIERIHDKNPLVHCITNYVTVNQVANILLACGASPVMADDEKEVEEITAMSDALVINLGTLNSRTIQSMFLAGEKAKEKGIPIILDPVGAGATLLRTQTAKDLLEKIKPTVLRANASEIMAIGQFKMGTRGVDAVDPFSLSEKVDVAKDLAKTFQTIVVMTGKVDIITDGKDIRLVSNGTSEMTRVTGTGCQLTALIAATIASDAEDLLDTVTKAVAMMGIAGESALYNLKENEGNMTYQNKIIDAIYNMTDETLKGKIHDEKVEG